MSTVAGGRRGRKANLSFEVLEDRLVLTVAGELVDQAAYEAWRSQTFTIDSTTVSENADEVAFDSPIDVESFGDDVQAQVTPSGNLIGLTQLQQSYSYRGQGYSVVVIDTGIDYRDTALGGGFGAGYRVIAGYDFVNNDGDPMDDNGHGTHVAGIIGSSDSTYTGVAPNVNLIALKVLGASGSGSFGDVEDALQWVVSHQSQYNIVAVNMSLGAGNYSSNSFTFLEDEFTNLANQGVFVAVASGNSFYDYGSTPGVGYPAISNNVVSVGAVWNGNYGSVSWSGGGRDNTTAADRITSFTQRGSALDILAPGAMVTSTYLNNAFVSMAGTSMASPFIAGAAAIVRQAMDAYGVTTSNYRNYILNVMQNTGVSIVDGDDENDNVTNTGLTFKRLDLLSAVQSIVNQAEPAPTPTTASLPFSDSFTRNDSRWVGSNWTTRLGDYRISGNSVTESTGAPSLVTLNTSMIGDITVQADVNDSAAGAYTSLVARYSGTGDANMYVAGLTNQGAGQIVAQIYRVTGGVWTLLSSKAVSTGVGTLRFEAYGASLTLFLNGQVVGSAVDGTLASGLVGIRGAGGITDNFSAQAVPLDSRVATTLPYTDDFTRVDSRDLGTHWMQVSGQLVVGGGRALATPSVQSVYTLTTVNAADVSLSATVDVSGTAGWGTGLIARRTGTGQYWAAIVLRGSSPTLEIWRTSNGASVQIGAAAVNGMSGTLRFDVTGTSLTAYWNGQQTVSVVDTVVTGAGAVGLQAFHGAIDNFSAQSLANQPLAPSGALPFTDAFDRTNASNLGSQWVQEQGQLTLTNGKATATPGTLSDSAVNGVATADVSLSTTVDITGTPGWGTGLFARKTGSGLYWAAVILRNNTPTLEIWRTVNGLSSAIASTAVSGLSGTLRFDVVGTTLTTYWNGQQVKSLTDTALSGAGEIGIRAFHGSVDGFSAQSPSSQPTTPAGSLPFSDDFNRTNSATLGSQWLQEQGQLTLTNGKATATAGTLSDSAVASITATDVSLSATIDVTGTPGWGTGLFARKTNTGLYWAAIVLRNNAPTLEIWRTLNGTSVALSSTVVSGTSGVLRFDVVGSTLTAYWNGQVARSLTDSSLPAAGEVGIRAFHGTVDGFSATSSASQPSTATGVPFSDSFDRSNSSNLGPQWLQEQGQLTLTNSKATATAGTLSDSAVSGASVADVSLSAIVDITGTPGWGTGLFARKSSSGLYWAAIILRGNTPTLEIWRTANGTSVALSSNAVSATGGVLRFDVIGTTLTAYWNGQQVRSLTDSAISAAGEIGIRAFHGSVDSFAATALGTQNFQPLESLVNDRQNVTETTNNFRSVPVSIVNAVSQPNLSFNSPTTMAFSTANSSQSLPLSYDDANGRKSSFSDSISPYQRRNLRSGKENDQVFERPEVFLEIAIEHEFAVAVAERIEPLSMRMAALNSGLSFQDALHRLTDETLDIIPDIAKRISVSNISR